LARSRPADQPGTHTENVGGRGASEAESTSTSSVHGSGEERAPTSESAAASRATGLEGSKGRPRGPVGGHAALEVGHERVAVSGGPSHSHGAGEKVTAEGTSPSR